MSHHHLRAHYKYWEHIPLRKLRFAPIAFAVLMVSACSSSGTTPSAQVTNAPGNTPTTAPQPTASPTSGTLTVWLMNGSLNDNSVVQLDTEFQMAHPGWKVNYQVQQWNGIVDKLTTSLASNNPPDVVEMGNTQAITFEAAGALMDLTSSRAALNGGTSNDSASADQAYLASLNSASVYQDKLFAMPFYAGDRVLIYRKDLFTSAGIDPSTLTSKDKLIAAAKTLQQKNSSVTDFSGLYVAGQNWYSLLQMIWDRGGTLATQSNGTWSANLESAASMQGIQDYVDYYKAGSTGPMNNDEMNPPEYTLFQQGKVGMFVGNGWEISSAIGTKGASRPRTRSASWPSRARPTARPSRCSWAAPSWALRPRARTRPWPSSGSSSSPRLRASSSSSPTAGSRTLKSAAANIPDTADTKILKVQAPEAAAGSGFTPNDPRWAGVEANNPIKTMLTKILTGQASVADAAKEADQKIDAVLNAAQ